MASSVVLRRHIGDITQCPICLDVFDTPTSLPCLHTFCLPCLRRIFAADQPGDVASCPVCRRDFQVPAGGLADLPRNFTVDGLVELSGAPTRGRSQSAPSSMIVTETAEWNDKPIVVAGDIVQYLDEMRDDVEVKVVEDDAGERAAAAKACTGTPNAAGLKCPSSVSTVTQPDHDQQHEDGASSTDDATTATTTCDWHGGSAAEQFCFDCGVDACATCCSDVHLRHRRRPVADVTAECQRRVAAELARLTDALNATHHAILVADHRRTDLLNELRCREDVIRNECDDDEVEKRLRALSDEKDDRLRQLTARQQQLEMDQLFLETFLGEGARKMTTVTTTAGLLRVVKEVKAEASCLLRVHQTRLDKSNVDDMQQMELVSTLAAEAEERPVCALTSLADELYLARFGTHDIEVFDVQSFSLRRRLTVATSGAECTLLVAKTFLGRAGFADMTSCRRHRCLYVVTGSGAVYRLDSSTGRQVTRWTVAGHSPAGLSVAGSTFNVVVSCRDSPSLFVYTPLGCPVGEVVVPCPAAVSGLLHAVQFGCGQFVVIAATQSAHRLVACVRVNDAHQTSDVIRSSGIATHVASCGDRCVWLAERGTSAGVRLVPITAQPQCCAQLPAVELEEPDRICWDDNGRRLYVVDHGRVKVFRVHMKWDLFKKADP